MLKKILFIITIITYVKAQNNVVDNTVEWNSDFNHQSLTITSTGALTINSVVTSDFGWLTIENGGSLTIRGSLTIQYNCDNDNGGSLTIQSGGSLIAATASGPVVYTRNLNSDNWYLVSSPVLLADQDAFAVLTANSISTGTGNNVGIATYTTSDDSWNYMQSGATGTGTFTPGKGFAVKRQSAGDISFTGTFNTDDVRVPVTSGFNLLGNPYTSYIDGVLLLSEIGNSGISAESTLWVWNQATTSYDAFNMAKPMIIAPAQGFIVKANADGEYSITKSMQQHSGDTFQRRRLRTARMSKIYLTVSNQTDARHARIYYLENTTVGFDVGYDGELFNGVSNPLAIYTHLVADSEGKNYQVQSLPPNNYENMIVPVGINAVSGTAISITASTENLPDGINIYLEDKQDNSFTRLDADSSFNTTFKNDIAGIGRFYLHTTAGTLSM